MFIIIKFLKEKYKLSCEILQSNLYAHEYLYAILK